MVGILEVLVVGVVGGEPVAPGEFGVATPPPPPQPASERPAARTARLAEVLKVLFIIILRVKCRSGSRPAGPCHCARQGLRGHFGGRRSSKSGAENAGPLGSPESASGWTGNRTTVTGMATACPCALAWPQLQCPAVPG